MRVKLRSVRWEADGINSYVLEPIDGAVLPPFTAGAHIDVQLAPKLARSYSMVSDPAERGFYEIAVHHVIDGRGGSKHIHENWRVGELLEISEPKNNFPLDESAPHSILIAGGIGITPILTMAARLEALGKSWEMHYVAATPERAAFVDRVKQYAQSEVAFDGIPGGRRLDLQGIAASAPEGTHLYCCGPPGMLKGFVAATETLPKGNAHIEYFSAETEVAAGGGYKLELARSGQAIEVGEGETMLDALLGAGVDIGFACAEGVCGTCRVGVLSGVPDHRDHFLTDEEKAANAAVMVCCSGSKTPSLVLDL